MVHFSLAYGRVTFERHIVTASHRAGQRPRFQWSWAQGDSGQSRGRYVEFEGLEWRFQESGADAAEFASALEIEFDSDNYGKASRPSESPKRPNLFFLRPAAIERRSKPNSLAADSGSDNKATATWAMLHHRFRYHIGEVCPIDLATTRILSYAHDLLLPRPLPDPRRVTPRTVSRGTMACNSVPPASAAAGPTPLGSVLLLCNSRTKAGRAYEIFGRPRRIRACTQRHSMRPHTKTENSTPSCVSQKTRPAMSSRLAPSRRLAFLSAWQWNKRRGNARIGTAEVRRRQFSADRRRPDCFRCYATLQSENSSG